MKNVLKKIVAGTAIVSTVACLSVSAFAATASVSSDKNSVTLTDWTAGSSTNQYTVVIVPADASEINENNIYYINQDNGTGMATIVNSMGVKSTLADGDYQVRIGTDVAGAAIEAFNFTVSSTPTGITLSFGDVNGDASINGADASLILQREVGLITGFTNGTYVIPDTLGDVNGDTSVNGADASLVLQKEVGLVTEFTNGTTVLDKYTFQPTTSK